MTLPGSLGKSLGWMAAAVALALVSAHGGPFEEIRALSKLPPLDLAKLKGGEIVTQRGAEGDFARGISLESCYFIAAPLEVVGNDRPGIVRDIARHDLDDPENPESTDALQHAEQKLNQAMQEARGGLAR